MYVILWQVTFCTLHGFLGDSGKRRRVSGLRPYWCCAIMKQRRSSDIQKRILWLYPNSGALGQVGKWLRNRRGGKKILQSGVPCGDPRWYQLPSQPKLQQEATTSSGLPFTSLSHAVSRGNLLTHVWSPNRGWGWLHLTSCLQNQSEARLYS